MIECGDSWDEVLRQMLAVRGALDGIVMGLIRQYLDDRLSAQIQSLSPAEQQQMLGEVVRLYEFICRHEPQISGKEI